METLSLSASAVAAVQNWLRFCHAPVLYMCLMRDGFGTGGRSASDSTYEYSAAGWLRAGERERELTVHAGRRRKRIISIYIFQKGDDYFF